MKLSDHRGAEIKQATRSHSATPHPQPPDYSKIVPDERRRRLLNAAINVIGENSLENVTMDRIAKVAGVTRVTLYREFGNRGTLIEAVIAYRLVLFDEKFFARIGPGLALSELVQRYLVASTQASKNNPVSRRWAGGGMKFLYAGSLIHRVATATWAPVLASHTAPGRPFNGIEAEEIGLWLIVLQYSLGRMVVETGCDETAVLSLVSQFVSPAFSVR